MIQATMDMFNSPRVADSAVFAEEAPVAREQAYALGRASVVLGTPASLVEQISSALAALKIVSARLCSSLVSVWTEIKRFPP